MTLTLGDMTRDETLYLAQRLIDYAMMPHRHFKRTKPQSGRYMPIEEGDA
jgi:hypothetical protein